MNEAVWPFLWAQSSSPSSPSPSPNAAGADPIAVAVSALRRWCSALTLSSPDPVPRPWAFWAFWTSLALLLAAAVLSQGPSKAIRQLFDFPGHVRLWSASLRRARRAGRFVAVMLTATAAQWTLAQLLSWNDPNRLAEWNLLRKTKTLAELAVEQGWLAALVPFRDVVGLSANLFLTIGFGVLVFRYSAERWPRAADGPSSRKATLFWGAAWLTTFYRLVGEFTDPGGLPPGGCAVFEGAIVPVLLLATDGLLLAWALSELRGPVDLDRDSIDLADAIERAPAAFWACLLALPALYAADAGWLVSPYVKSLPAFLGRTLRPVLSFLLHGWGLAALQTVAPLFLPVFSSIAWSGGRIFPALAGGFRVFRAQGARLVVAFALSASLAGLLSALSYFAVLSLPTQPWILAAADAYAHFATLPIGCFLLSLLVELGAQTFDPAHKP